MPITETNMELSPTDFIDPLKIQKIVSSRDFLDGNWKKATKLQHFKEEEIQKFAIPIDCTFFNFHVLTVVAPLTIIPRHAHKEPTLRYILKGSLELNGAAYSEGDWILVPRGFPYEIRTKSGYTALIPYSTNCEECSWKALSKMPLGKMDA
jgi:hypothetical protein